MKLTIVLEDIEVSVESPAVCMNDVIKELLIPALLAAGFHQDTINRYIVGDDGEL